jgi:hypothetical protein
VVLGVEHCDSKDSGSKNTFFQVGALESTKRLPLTKATGNEKLHATSTSHFLATSRIYDEHQRLCCCPEKRARAW